MNIVICGPSEECVAELKEAADVIARRIDSNKFDAVLFGVSNFGEDNLHFRVVNLYAHIEDGSSNAERKKKYLSAVSYNGGDEVTFEFPLNAPVEDMIDKIVEYSSTWEKSEKELNLPEGMISLSHFIPKQEVEIRNGLRALSAIERKLFGGGMAE